MSVLAGLKYRGHNDSDVHPELLSKALAAMQDRTTVDEFHSASGIASRSVAKGVLDFVLARDIGNASRGGIAFCGRDRLQVAALALQAGADIELVSQHLSWKDFESLASEVLRSLGYATKTNVRLTKPRMEIDVLGVDAGFALAVDCKHWKRSNLSSISKFCAKQAARTQELVKRDLSISIGVPAIMTLHAERLRFVGGIPVVPVLQFRSFAMDVKGLLDDMAIIRQAPAARQMPQR
jgi:hypothetical protein